MNSQAENEQSVPTISDDLTKQFGEVCFLYGCIFNDGYVTQETTINRFKWLADEAKTLAEIAMQIHDAGGF